MSSNALRLQGLIDSLLKLQQVGHAGERIESVRLRFDELVQQVVTTHSWRHAVNACASPARWRRSRFLEDARNRRRWWTILVSNAISSRPRVGRWRFPWYASKGRRYSTSWIRGRDIPANERGQVFVLHCSANARGAAGVGLGLAIAREFAVAHRGTLELMDVPVGTHFRLTLPVAGGVMIRASAARLGGALVCVYLAACGSVPPVEVTTSPAPVEEVPVSPPPEDPVVKELRLSVDKLSAQLTDAHRRYNLLNEEYRAPTRPCARVRRRSTSCSRSSMPCGLSTVTAASPDVDMTDKTRPKILVVDDDPDLLHLIGVRLTVGGYAVTQAASGTEALERFHADHPQAVITDLRMAGMDGDALFARLHAEAPKLPVIILTAHGTIPDAVAATQRGVFGFLTKPFDGLELLIGWPPP